MVSVPRPGVIYVTVDGQRVPAWTCGCGEPIDTPNRPTGIVQLLEALHGVRFVVAHLDCMQPAGPPE